MMTPVGWYTSISYGIVKGKNYCRASLSQAGHVISTISKAVLFPQEGQSSDRQLDPLVVSHPRLTASEGEWELVGETDACPFDVVDEDDILKDFCVLPDEPDTTS